MASILGWELKVAQNLAALDWLQDGKIEEVSIFGKEE
jgi:hypothetical protein